MPEHMLPVDMQATNEHYYSRKFIDKRVLKVINDTLEEEVITGIQLLQEWLSLSYYESKQNRLKQLKQFDLENLVKQIFIGVAYCQTPETFVNITGQLASRLKFSDKREGILTVAEIVAVLMHTKAYELFPDRGKVYIQCHFKLPKELIESIERSRYLPPMVCEPKELTSNYESPYLTHNDSLILGKQNTHSGNICLDTLNQQNSIALSLSEEFLSAVPEEPTHDINNMEKQWLWEQFKGQSQEIYNLLIKQGNKFWLTNKVDKRGRMYAQGYHVTPQGTCYKKAMIELYNEEYVTGVPQ